jgi:hypothetical protein
MQRQTDVERERMSSLARYHDPSRVKDMLTTKRKKKQGKICFQGQGSTWCHLSIEDPLLCQGAALFKQFCVDGTIREVEVNGHRTLGSASTKSPPNGSVLRDCQRARALQNHAAPTPFAFLEC